MSIKNIILAAIILTLFVGCSKKQWPNVEIIEHEISETRDIDPGINTDEIREYLISDYRIEGHWEYQSWHDGVDLTITEISENRFQIICEAWGDVCFGWSLERVGEYNNGVLSLDRPIKTCSPELPYENFYSINTPKGIRLLTPSDIRTWIIEKEDPEWSIILGLASLKLKEDTQPTGAGQPHLRRPISDNHLDY